MQFFINPEKMAGRVSELDSIQGELGKLSSSLESVINTNAIQLDSFNQIKRALKNYQQNIRVISGNTAQMSAGLQNVVKEYKEHEQSICEHAQTTLGKAVGVKNSIKNATSQIAWGDIIKNATDLIGDVRYKASIAAAGPLGTLVDAVVNLNDQKYGKTISDVIKLAGGAVKNYDGSKIKWEDWFGVNPSTKGPWEGAIGKYTDFSSAQKGFSTACNWAAAIVSSGYSNYQEFGNFGARFWEETAAETLINVGEGVLIGAGVAGIAALAGISAPALAVGAVAAGVTVLVDAGLNAVVSWATGGVETDWKEVVSDFVCDKFEEGVDWVKNTAQKTVDWAKDTGEKIGNAVSNGIAGIKNTMQNIAGSICNWGRFSFG